jgi:hypothetical protein
MALSSRELEAKREELIEKFEEYRDQVLGGMSDVITALHNGEYAHACELMSTISSHQGQASVRMRAVLVKQGFIVRERQDG